MAQKTGENATQRGNTSPNAQNWRIGAEVKSRVRQVWGAYTLDDNGLELVLFGRELEGYRHAANNGMRCKPIQFGKSVMQQLGQQK
jgi:hypothetical protein